MTQTATARADRKSGPHIVHERAASRIAIKIWSRLIKTGSVNGGFFKLNVPSDAEASFEKVIEAVNRFAITKKRLQTILARNSRPSALFLKKIHSMLVQLDKKMRTAHGQFSTLLLYTDSWHKEAANAQKNAKAVVPSPMGVSSSRWVTDIKNEIMAICANYDDVTFDAKTGLLSATIRKSIILCGVDFGRFRIVLNVNKIRKGGEHAYSLEALSPLTVTSHPAVTHPHVHTNKLCEGDSKARMEACWKEGKIHDAFNIIDSILRNYNPGSPHLQIERWIEGRERDRHQRIKQADQIFWLRSRRMLNETVLPAIVQDPNYAQYQSRYLHPGPIDSRRLTADEYERLLNPPPETPPEPQPQVQEPTPTEAPVAESTRAPDLAPTPAPQATNEGVFGAPPAGFINDAPPPSEPEFEPEEDEADAPAPPSDDAAVYPEPDTPPAELPARRLLRRQFIAQLRPAEEETFGAAQAGVPPADTSVASIRLVNHDPRRVYFFNNRVDVELPPTEIWCGTCLDFVAAEGSFKCPSCNEMACQRHTNSCEVCRSSRCARCAASNVTCQCRASSERISNGAPQPQTQEAQ